jgi:hypothetical protein
MQPLAFRDKANDAGETPAAHKVASGVLLAWAVTTDDAEGTVIVWAKNRSQAKSIGMRSEWLDGCEWNDIKATREPRADGLRNHPCAMREDPDTEDLRLMRTLGWHEIDGHDEPCPQCGLYEWRDVPESRITADTGLCAGCQANVSGEGRGASLDEFWGHLKDYDRRTTESMGIALTVESLLHSEGQRIAVRSLQSWLLAHGYKPTMP